jgi:hypothetical protein
MHMWSGRVEKKTAMGLKVIETHDGPLAMSCATCRMSEFARGNLHSCTADDGVLVDEDHVCGRWQPLLFEGRDGGMSVFGAGSDDTTPI